MNNQDSKTKVNKIMFPILGIDYGKKRIGLAVSDSKGVLASPLKHVTVSNKTGIKGAINIIKSIAKEWRVKTIVLGYPQAFKEKHKEIGVEIEDFAETLRNNFNMPIIFYDESFSTRQAENIVIEGGSNVKASKGKIDSIASAVMLQEFLYHIKRN